MHKLRRSGLAGAVFTASLLGCLGAASADLEWRAYVDPVLGYSLLYPSVLFDGASVREHGGVTITSSGGARLYIFGDRNSDGRSAEAVAAKVSGYEDIGEVTYRRLADRWLVLSGYIAGGPQGPPGSIFYERIAFSPDHSTLAGFRLVYSQAQRALFDPIIATIGRSLKAPASEHTAMLPASPLQANADPASAARAHQEWCRRKYSTYEPATDSFLRYDGRYVPCVAPRD
jgi:hypothetical protein